MAIYLLNNSGGAAAGAVKYETHTWAIGGEIKVPASDTGFIPPMFASKLAGTTLTLVNIRTRINSGTSATIKMVRKTAGGAIADIATGVSVTTASADSAAIGTLINHNDEVRPEVTAVSGTPTNITITATFKRES